MYLENTCQGFRLSLKFISFHFFADSGDLTVMRKKRKSPSNKRRDKERMNKFRRKEETTSPEPSPTFYSITPMNIPQYEGNYSIVEEEEKEVDTTPSSPFPFCFNTPPIGAVYKCEECFEGFWDNEGAGEA